jgi:hypothetical protein
LEVTLRKILLACLLLLAGCTTTGTSSVSSGKDVAGTAGNIVGVAQYVPSLFEQCSEKYPDRSQEFSRLSIKYKRENEWIIDRAYAVASRGYKNFTIGDMKYTTNKAGSDHIINGMKGQPEEKWLEACDRMVSWCENKLVTCSPIEDLVPNQVKLILDASN